MNLCLFGKLIQQLMLDADRWLLNKITLRDHDDSVDYSLCLYQRSCMKYPILKITRTAKIVYIVRTRLIVSLNVPQKSFWDIFRDMSKIFDTVVTTSLQVKRVC